ncbi:MAG: methyltransferase domain-containing protein [Acidobacteriota bacterium]|nr:methyltransferase domain-containing protein [Acidobacteriota bacterium]
MTKADNYEEYTRAAMDKYARTDAAEKNLLVDALKNTNPRTILDLGCGAGQDILPFIERTDAFCVGLDYAAELGAVVKNVFGRDELKNRAAFARATGERMPFADASFDAVLCRVALPYMHNRRTFAEVARILKPNGVFLLKTHAPAFYFALLKERLKTFNPKQIAYPLICLAGSVWHQTSGKQLTQGFWAGKEIFQTAAFVRSECAKNNLKIERELADTNRQTPSFFIRKIK